MNFKCGDELYTTSLDNINELMIDCNGDILACNFPIGNIIKDNILNIIKEYNPYKNSYTKSLLENGISGLFIKVCITYLNKNK